MVGYTGGESVDPTYKSVCSGDGHTEALKVEFDPSKVDYADLLEVFYRNCRAESSGKPQYKSAIWVHSEEQREKAKAAAEARGKLDKGHRGPKAVVRRRGLPPEVLPRQGEGWHVERRSLYVSAAPCPVSPYPHCSCSYSSLLLLLPLLPPHSSTVFFSCLLFCSVFCHEVAGRNVARLGSCRGCRGRRFGVTRRVGLDLGPQTTSRIDARAPVFFCKRASEICFLRIPARN
ncbi:unnamed protein product [Prorocentrum cordatum]|uniref:peptide-methionine (S)-S-oxide reductase n=1 Tax=Prorocentrum cordatum TaxID=2364126 RepID=A0ABN9SUF8_9DINO|nr:unnamed protein product [Polarella glacialis]